MNPTIAADLYRYTGRTDLRAFLSCMLRSPGFRFTYFLRKASGCPRWNPCGLVFRLLHRRYFYKYGLQIGLNRNIGPGLYIGHFGNVLVHVNARLGQNCNLGPGVNIGQVNRGARRGCPTIGNRVWIGTGAVLVGRITIGDNVLIAPNSFVSSDVPSDSIVVGNPPRIMRSREATLGYIESTLDESALDAPLPGLTTRTAPADHPEGAAPPAPGDAALPAPASARPGFALPPTAGEVTS